MNITSHVRLETESLDDIAALLEGRVFHVTRLSNLAQIMRDKEIKPNGDGALETTFGSAEKSFFRKRNCVSLFDYRPAPTDKIKEFRERCSPFKPARPETGGIAILLLKTDAYPALIPWTRCREERTSNEMVVPHVEAGYSGSLSIDLIDEVISLTIKEDPKSHSALLRKAHHTMS